MAFSPPPLPLSTTFLQPITANTGLTASFVVSEYILSTTMEWLSCLLLMLTYVTSLNDSKKGNMTECSDVGKETSTDGVGDAYVVESRQARWRC